MLRRRELEHVLKLEIFWMNNKTIIALNVITKFSRIDSFPISISMEALL